jgi:hypothetical protein
MSRRCSVSLERIGDLWYEVSKLLNRRLSSRSHTPKQGARLLKLAKLNKCRLPQLLCAPGGIPRAGIVDYRSLPSTNERVPNIIREGSRIEEQSFNRFDHRNKS